MGISDLFDAYDAILFVDESNASTGADASRFVYGRLFTADRRADVVALEKELTRTEAEHWHGRDGASLLTETETDFAGVIAALDACRSWLVSMRVRPSQLVAINNLYQQAVRDQPHLRPTWPKRGHPDYTSLFRFISFAHPIVIERQEADDIYGSRTLIICDRQPFLSRDRGDGFGDLPGYRYDWETETGYAQYSCAAVAVVDPTRVVDAIRFLSLVDSELWAFRRFLAFEMPDGRTLDEHAIEWGKTQHAGHVITQEAIEKVIEGSPASATGESKLLGEYWSRVLFDPGQRQRTIVLGEKPDDGETD